MLGSILGSLCFGKLPFTLRYYVSPPQPIKRSYFLYSDHVIPSVVSPSREEESSRGFRIQAHGVYLTNYSHLMVAINSTLPCPE